MDLRRTPPENIYATIINGRPNGMPAFGGKIPPQQVWQIVAYVQLDVRPGVEGRRAVAIRIICS